MTRALDSAFPRWTIAELKAAGIVAVFRYLAFKPNGKVIEKPEYDGYIANGIAVGLVWESSGHSFTGGYAVGYVEGAEARKQARLLGHPDDRPLYTAYDVGALPSQVIMDYQRGFNDGAGPSGAQGVYGDVAIGHALLDAGRCSVFWQTNARGWPGDRVDSPRAVMIQRYAQVVPGVTGSYDVDDVFAADFGQHPRPVVAPVPKPSPPTQHPTISIGDPHVHTTLISGIHLDGDGNGEVAVHKVPAQHVIATVVIGGSNPLVARRYDKTPTTRVVNDSNPALVVISAGEPNGTYSLNVSSV